MSTPTPATRRLIWGCFRICPTIKPVTRRTVEYIIKRFETSRPYDYIFAQKGYLMKPLTFFLTAILLSATSLTACGWSENSMSIQEQMEQRFKLNPNPKEAYRIRIKINDAPGPMKFMDDMYIRYMARNCSYEINKFEGVDTEPRKYIYPAVSQIRQGEYETVVYFDAMQDEDYFGQGVCRWQIDGFGGTFKATGKPEETAFSISDVMEDLIAKKTLTKYYWKARYPYTRKEDGTITLQNDNIPNMPELAVGPVENGSDSVEEFGIRQRQELFTITINLEEVK